VFCFQIHPDFRSFSTNGHQLAQIIPPNPSPLSAPLPGYAPFPSFLSFSHFDFWKIFFPLLFPKFFSSVTIAPFPFRAFDASLIQNWMSDPSLPENLSLFSSLFPLLLYSSSQPSALRRLGRPIRFYPYPLPPPPLSQESGGLRPVLFVIFLFFFLRSFFPLGPCRPPSLPFLPARSSTWSDELSVGVKIFWFFSRTFLERSCRNPVPPGFPGSYWENLWCRSVWDSLRCQSVFFLHQVLFF